MNARTRARVVSLVMGSTAALAAIVLTACAQPDNRTAAERLADPKLDPDDRALAVQEFLDEQSQDPNETKQDRRDRLLSLFADRTSPQPIRLAVLESLSTSEDQQDKQAIRDTLALLLPTEPSENVVAYAGAVAAEQGWTELATPLIRRLAVPVSGKDESERTETKSLARIFPGKPVREIALDVFLDPQTPDVSGDPRLIDLDLPTKASDAAWQLLARLDASGAYRREVLASATPDQDPSNRLDAIRRFDRDFSMIPITTTELAWARSLASDDPADREWWAQTKSAFDTLSPSRQAGLGIRHLEPIRYASIHDPALLNMSRQELNDTLDRTLEPRRHITRTADFIHAEGRNREKLADWNDRLSWADLLAAIIIDRAVFDPVTIASLERHAAADRDDKTTEYGGSIDTDATSAFILDLFPPRPSERRGDGSFVASQEMRQASDKALAHFHLQVQRSGLGPYAGPSRGDLQYAARSGRTCVVYTLVGERRINADFYTPNGAVIDLGIIDLQTKSAAR